MTPRQDAAFFMNCTTSPCCGGHVWDLDSSHGVAFTDKGVKQNRERHDVCYRITCRFLAYVLLSGAVPASPGAALSFDWVGGGPGVIPGHSFLESVVLDQSFAGSHKHGNHFISPARAGEAFTTPSQPRSLAQTRCIGRPQVRSFPSDIRIRSRYCRQSLDL